MRKNGSWFWWVVVVCAAAVIVIFLLRGGPAPGPGKEKERFSLPEKMRVSGTMSTGDAAPAGSGPAPPEPIPPAVEHGTAPLSVSWEGSFPLEYVDGPIVFQDDFESGTGKWTVHYMRPSENGVVVDESMAVVKGASIKKRKVRGKSSMVAVMEADKSGRYAVLLPDSFFKAEAYSLSADTNIAPGSGLNCLITSAGRQKVVYHDHEFEHRPDVWLRVRVAFVFRVDEKLGKYCEVKFFINGTLIDHRYDYGDEAIPGFVIDKGRGMIDNVVIRKMVPK